MPEERGGHARGDADEAIRVGSRLTVGERFADDILTG